MSVLKILKTIEEINHKINTLKTQNLQDVDMLRNAERYAYTHTLKWVKKEIEWKDDSE